METKDITKAIENAVAKYLDAKFAEETKPMQFITKGGKPKASKGLKAQQATLVPAIREHKADFDNSALRFKAEKLYKKATLRACILAFASENKFAELEAWATKKKNQELNTWWKSL